MDAINGKMVIRITLYTGLKTAYLVKPGIYKVMSTKVTMR